MLYAVCCHSMRRSAEWIIQHKGGGERPVPHEVKQSVCISDVTDTTGKKSVDTPMLEHNPAHPHIWWASTWGGRGGPG